MKKQLLILIIGLLATSCGKNLLSNKIEGKVVGLIGGNGIAGASVYLVKETSNGLLAPTSGDVVMTTTTDSAGGFSLDFKQTGGDYTVYVRKNGYYDEQTTSGVQSYITLPGHGNMVKKKMTLYLHEPAYLIVTLKNASMLPDSATLSFPDLRDPSSDFKVVNCSSTDINIQFVVPAGVARSSRFSINNNGTYSNGYINIPSISPYTYQKVEVSY